MGQPPVVAIGCRHNFHPRNLGGDSRVILSLPTRSNQSNLKMIVRGYGPGGLALLFGKQVMLDAAGDESPGGRDSARYQKISARSLVCHKRRSVSEVLSEKRKVTISKKKSIHAPEGIACSLLITV